MYKDWRWPPSCVPVHSFMEVFSTQLAEGGASPSLFILSTTSTRVTLPSLVSTLSRSKASERYSQSLLFPSLRCYLITMLNVYTVEDRNQRAVVQVFIITPHTSKAKRRLIKRAINFPVFPAHRVWRIYCPQTPRLITILLRDNTYRLITVNVPINLEYHHSVCLLLRIETPSHPFSRKLICPSHGTKEGGEGVGESQFRQL